MKRMAFLIAAAGAAIAATPALGAVPAAGPANCVLRIESSASSWIIRGYDPFGGAPASGTFELTFTNDGDRACEFRPSFVVDGEPFGLRGGDGRRVPYALMDMFGGYDATPSAGRTLRRINQRTVVVQPHSQQIVQYGFAVSPEAISGDGLYEQRVIVEADGTDEVPLNARQISLGIDVLPSAALGLSGAFRMNNGRATVDLGELHEGVAPVPLRLRVESTRRYQLTMESQNNGRLRMAGTEWSVPYQLVVADQAVHLGSGEGRYRGEAGTGLRRDSLPLAFLIGDVSDRRAGTYSDVISISVTPQ